MSKKFFLAFFSPILVLFLISCSVSNNPQQKEIKKLQKGAIKEDSSYVYQLPYEEGKSHLLVQGYYSNYTHRERAALDFKMKNGTKICAARAGVVVRVKEDGDKGGGNKKYRPYGNVIVIEHEDSSRAGYWHLQFNGVLVNVGYSVKEGEVIGLSGNTGYTYFPHLHFIVWKFDKSKQWMQIGTRFKTSKGDLYLRPLKKYKSKIQAY